VLRAFDTEAEYDGFLGELIFSSNNPAYDIANNMDRASNPGFRAWLKEKVDKCTDLEERMALSSLSQILEGVIERLGENAVFEEPIADAEFADGTSSSSTEAAADTPLGMIDMFYCY
jgi:hypothetical protein